MKEGFFGYGRCPECEAFLKEKDLEKNICWNCEGIINKKDEISENPNNDLSSNLFTNKMNEDFINYLNSINHEELHKMSDKGVETLSSGIKDSKDLDETELFSYINLLRFENHLNSFRWLSKTWDLFHCCTGSILKFPVMQRLAPELYKGINITKENFDILSSLNCWINTRCWLESNIKHVRLSNNVSCSFNLGLICALSSFGLPFTYCKQYKGPLLNNLKNIINFKELHQNRFEGKFSQKRKASYPWELPGREEYNDEYDDSRIFTQILRCIGIYALKHTKENIDDLGYLFDKKKYLIDKVIYPLSYLVDKSALAYYSNGDITANVSYAYNNDDPSNNNTNYEFEILDKVVFDKIINKIAIDGKSYIEPISDYFFDIGLDTASMNKIN
jgi:hypothetical protein|tara:strand:- start:511 stop:1677 length:1167 start_codon:yes stop_codon:yes gene_type:complete